MKRPVLYLPALADQEILMRALYALKLGITFNGKHGVDDGWQTFVKGYTVNDQCCYPYVYLNNKAIGITTWGADSWAALSPDLYVKVNSVAQFLAYVKTNHPAQIPKVPVAAPSPLAVLKKIIEEDEDEDTI